MINQLPASRRRQVLLALLSAALLSFVLGYAWHVKQRASAQLARERAALAAKDRVPFEKRARPAHAPAGIQFRQNTRNVRSIIRFNDLYYTATDGGLVAHSIEGQPIRRFTVLDGLPESDLTSLAVYGAKLYAGTRARGLVAFDGERFEQYLWTDREPQAVTALLVSDGRLLIGTFAGGLLEFDGRNFGEIKARREQQRLKRITALAKTGPRLYVGTFDDGLHVAEAGRWLHYSAAHGLPSERIVGLLSHHSRLLVATDFGLAVADRTDQSDAETRPFRTLITLPALSSLTEYDGRVLFCQDNGDLFELAGGRAQRLMWKRPAHLLENCQLVTADGELWLVAQGGVWRAARGEAGRASAGLAPFGDAGAEEMPASNLISALAVDGDGNLWAGNFRRGLDLFNRDGRRLAHLESEIIREINHLLPDRAQKAMLAATSQGTLLINSALRTQTITTTADGLLSNAVTQAALFENHGARQPLMAFATSRGLSLGEPGRLKGLTAAQGLPSNSLYAVLPHGRALYAGTLGGLAEIERGRVVRVWKDSNSRLTHNWVTALRVAGDRLFAGTYGGGVFELMPAGDLRSFAAETGGTSVNPGAMWNDEARLYVGTLDGVWVLELASQEWRHLRDELPSPVVLSVAGDERYVYFGTTGGIARVEKSYWELTPRAEHEDEN